MPSKFVQFAGYTAVTRINNALKYTISRQNNYKNLERGLTFKTPNHTISMSAPCLYLRPSDIGCQYSRSIYTACFIVWQRRRAADTSTNWRQSLFCCSTASMEQVTDGAETAAIDGLVSSWSENISVSFCLRAPGYGLTLWCALGLLVRGAIQSASVTVTMMKQM